MYVYLRSEQNLWTVGYYESDSSWLPESDHGSPQQAADQVHYLNAGRQDGTTEYVYLQTEKTQRIEGVFCPNVWTVGYYTPEDTWVPESDHFSINEALNRIDWLHGKERELEIDTVNRRLDEPQR